MLVANVKLGKDRRHLAMNSRIADVLFVRVVVGRVDDKFFRGWIVGGGRFDIAHVRSMAQLCHSKAARQLHRADLA